jgi:hypothetical protein
MRGVEGLPIPIHAFVYARDAIKISWKIDI